MSYLSAPLKKPYRIDTNHKPTPNTTPTNT